MTLCILYNIYIIIRLTIFTFHLFSYMYIYIDFTVILFLSSLFWYPFLSFLIILCLPSVSPVFHLSISFSLSLSYLPPSPSPSLCPPDLLSLPSYINTACVKGCIILLIAWNFITCWFKLTMLLGRCNPSHR